MKRITSMFLSLAIVLTMFATTPLTASAETYEKTIDGITYRIDTETGEAEVCYADETITTANIKSEVDGYKVTSIGEDAFFRHTALTSVTIPDSVTNIENWSFDGCTSLTTITIGNGLTSMGDKMFYDCVSLASINVSEDNQSYCSENGILFDKDKSQLIKYPAKKDDTTYEIPNSVTSFGWGAFADCTTLTAVVIPDSVISIGEWAFYCCTSLATVTIPTNSVLSIEPAAFFNCASLITVTIPNSVISISDSAFNWCTSLTSINVSEDNSRYCSEEGVLFNKDKTELIRYPIGKTEAVYVIPDSVTSIGTFAFSDCSSLTAITIPDSVTSISYDAFSGCTSLESVTIPDSVTSISYYAFSGCTSLAEITIPDSITIIDNYVFQGCSSLTTVTIPDSVTSIGVSAFEDCTSLTTITIPDSVTYIGEEAFGYYHNYGKFKLENFTIQGYADTAAETYANENGFIFVELEQGQPKFKGDCNGDGKISVADARKIVVAIAKGDTQALLEFGDVNNDGKISVADARKIIVAIAKNDFNF